MIRRLVVALLLAVGTAWGGPFVPIAPEDVPLYKVNLQRLYFASPAEQKADQKKLL